MSILKFFPIIAARWDYADNYSEAEGGHHGIDVFAPKGAPVLAVVSGYARRAEDRKGGHVIYLTEDTPGAPLRYYYYAHLDMVDPTLPTTIAFKAGKVVKAGQMIGTVGTSGNAAGTAPHLHFQMKESGRLTNPYPYLAEVDPTKTGAPKPDPHIFKVPDWVKDSPITQWLGGLAGKGLLILGLVWVASQDMKS